MSDTHIVHRTQLVARYTWLSCARVRGGVDLSINYSDGFGGVFVGWIILS